MRFLAIFAVVALGCNEPIEPVIADESYAFVGATVVDSRGIVAAGETTVFVSGGKIVFSGESEDLILADSVTRVDATGKWIVPGLMDLHIHVPRRRHQSETMKSMLAFGITTARVAASTSENGLTLKSRLETGSLIGPEIVTAGHLLDAPGSVHATAVEVETIEQIQLAVRDQAEKVVS